MDLSIVIVSYNTRDLLRACLESVRATLRGLRYETIVVDNGSTDGSLEIVTSNFPTVTLIRNDENAGFATANNQGIRRSSGRYLLLLNSDAVLLDNAARRMVAFMDAHPGAGGVGGQLRNPDGSFQNSHGRFPGLLDETCLLLGLPDQLRPAGYPTYPEAGSSECCRVDWVSGALLMVRRQAADEIGLLDEDFFMYAEEMDWCYRLQQGGWPVYYLPDARAVHWGGGSWRDGARRRRAQVYYGKWQFLRKHRGSLAAAAFWLLVRAASLPKMTAWLLAGLSSDVERRRRAWRQVASYWFLLTHAGAVYQPGLHRVQA